MRIFSYLNDQAQRVLAAMTDDSQIYDLPQRDFMQLVQQAEQLEKSPLEWVQDWMLTAKALSASLDELQLLVPIQAPEVWAAGVTYEKSRDARNYEATGGKLNAQTFYDKVYDAERPELFMKSTAARTVAPNEPVYLRSDSNWQIPEPELGLVITAAGQIVGYTIGNDMSCRDIEGENPLYLPQAKIWRGSCSIGPMIRLIHPEEDPYAMTIHCRIYRNEERAFAGQASVGQLKRKLDELVSYLVRDNQIFDGTVLLTGTCIVPPNDFTLQAGDRVEIEIPGIGVLNNPVHAQV